MKNKFLVPLLTGSLGIVLTISVIVGWNIIFTSHYTLATQMTDASEPGVGYWILLSVGDVFLAMIITALVIFLVSSFRQIRTVRRQNTFIDSVTHELKSPLASLRLCLETMEARELTPELAQKFRGMMVDDVDRLQAFIDHVLEAGRLEHNERELVYEATDVRELLQSCTKKIQLRHQISEDYLQIQCDLPDAAAVIQTDSIALEIILLNLMDNAVKYSEGQPDIIVSAWEEEGWLTVTVQDHGIGIENKKLNRIFRRFYRIARSKGRRVGGTGLGLYLSASLVKRFGGQISASSEGPGCGSTFRVEFPIVESMDGGEAESQGRLSKGDVEKVGVDTRHEVGFS